MTDCLQNEDCSGNEYCDMSQNICVSANQKLEIVMASFSVVFMLIAGIGSLLFLTNLKNDTYMWIGLIVVVCMSPVIMNYLNLSGCTVNQDGKHDCKILPKGVLEGLLFGLAFIGVGKLFIAKQN